mmetsp:Transcript_9786/g.30375  ORF Transcript_9786/g.30375 Transcript_9786/m.30375 type:complete len:226 (-) Transcript_9786:22-699(-)
MHPPEQLAQTLLPVGALHALAQIRRDRRGVRGEQPLRRQAPRRVRKADRSLQRLRPGRSPRVDLRRRRRRRRRRRPRGRRRAQHVEALLELAQELPDGPLGAPKLCLGPRRADLRGPTGHDRLRLRDQLGRERAHRAPRAEPPQRERQEARGPGPRAGHGDVVGHGCRAPAREGRLGGWRRLQQRLALPHREPQAAARAVEPRRHAGAPRILAAHLHSTFQSLYS